MLLNKVMKQLILILVCENNNPGILIVSVKNLHKNINGVSFKINVRQQMNVDCTSGKALNFRWWLKQINNDFVIATLV